MLWDVLSQFWEVVSREWERRGERARFLKVVELPDKSRQKVSATRSAGSSVRCCPGVGDAPRYQHSIAPLFLNHPLQY
jgi:hypothetical protein